MSDAEIDKAIMLNSNNRKKSLHDLTHSIQKQFLGPDHPAESRSNQLRVILYSHDTMGIGHMRRNLLIATQITRSFPNASVLVIAGAKEANTFAQQAGIDCLTLPAFRKNSNGTYSTRNLGISGSDVLSVRRETILAAVKSYQPDLFIVDKVAAGAGGELIPTLEWLSDETSCHCVLGLRDILDGPEKVKHDWDEAGTSQMIRRHYSSVWIYGDPEIYDALTEYNIPEDISELATFTGYLNTESRLKGLSQLPYAIDVPYVFCTVGGGQDGEQLALSFVEAIRLSPRNAVLLTGPYMPAESTELVQQRAEQIPHLKVVEFVDEGDLLIRNASHVISMGGYNTVAAILSHKKNALIVPRCVLRQEQKIRAQRLAALGFVSTLASSDLTPERLVNWLQLSGNSPRSTGLKMNGLNRITEIVEREFSTKLGQQTKMNKAESNGKH